MGVDFSKSILRMLLLSGTILSPKNSCFGFRVSGFERRVSGFWFLSLGFEFWVSVLGVQVWGSRIVVAPPGALVARLLKTYFKSGCPL